MKQRTDSLQDPIQTRIDAMTKGNKDAIIYGACSKTPILQINAILHGAKFKIKDPTFLEAIKGLCDSEEEILNISLSECAAAACAALDYMPYRGSDAHMREMIEAMKDGTII